MEVRAAAPDHGQEEFSEHGVQRRLGGRWLTALNAIALAFSTYQLVVAAFHPLSSLVIRSLHVGFLLCITFILYPAFKSGGRLSKVGVGDTAVAKRVKKLAEAFYGRAKALQDAFAALPAAETLRDVVARTVFEDGAGDPDALTAYLVSARDALSRHAVEPLLKGDVAWEIQP